MSIFRAKGVSLCVLHIAFLLLVIISQSEAYRIVGDSTVAIYWTAPGDDAHSGQAVAYDFRISTSSPGSDTTIWWQNAVEVNSMPAPSFAGRRDSCFIGGISFHKLYYFALRTADDAGNWSKLSNIGVFPNLNCADVNSDRSPAYTHPAIMRPLVDMAALAGADQITIGDACAIAGRDYLTTVAEPNGLTAAYVSQLQTEVNNLPGVPQTVTVQRVDMNNTSYWSWIDLGADAGEAGASSGKSSGVSSPDSTSPIFGVPESSAS